MLPEESADTLIVSSFPEKLIHPLLEANNRYITLYGGRGGMKSWSVADSLLIKSSQRPLRILCAREFMSSIQDSVHKLLSDRIHALGLTSEFKIEQRTIYGPNGTEFRFGGIRNNPQGLKSFEGIDICWVEEAQNVTKNSWEILIPTIRKPGSQILITFNPHLASDETFKRFVTNPPPDSIVVKINYDENPFLTSDSPLLQEALYMKEHDPDGYLNVWLGFPRVFLENAVYGKELRQALEEKRITSVPYDRSMPVHTFWDLGWRDMTSIIFAQSVGFEYHIIDFYESNFKSTTDYIKILQEKPYVYGTDHLPHDGNTVSNQTGRSIAQVMRSAGRTVRVLPRDKPIHGINAARLMFPNLYFDEKKTVRLIEALRNYSYDFAIDATGAIIAGKKAEPIHDGSSHAADAFRYMAMSLRPPEKAFDDRPMHIHPRETGWML